MKARHAGDVKRFEDIPNIGKKMAEDFKLLGIRTLADLKGKDPLRLYKKICALTHSRQDPCVLDTYMAAVDFMDGAPAKPWWHYTAQRKKQFR